ncbi:MAG: TldD/PmbA family protein [Hyphomicrobiales bacterium]|nr:TldD/PmbA family protein [Hyphomicrobiales bacterium]
MSSLLDQTALSELAERLVMAARRAGADAADVVAVRSMSLTAGVRDGEVEQSERAESDDVGLRVFVGRRSAVVSTNDIAGDVMPLAERAVAMARVAPEDRFAGLADTAHLAQSVPELDLLDAEMPPVAVLEDRALRAEAAALAVKGVSKSEGATASASIGGMVLATSHGFRGAYLVSRFGVSMSAIAGEGTAMETDYDYSSALHAADLETPEKVGRTAGERAAARLNPRKVETTRVPVIYDRRVASSLIGHLASAVNGSAVARKTSFLKDKHGERLFRPAIRVIDDPLRRRGLRSRPFDGEGVAGRRLALIDDGVLTSWLLDSATARELGLVTTGHAQRGVSSPPAPGATNLYLEAGPTSPEALIADIAQGFYVTGLIGMGVNPVTGDYSRGASGFWIENGQRTYPVSEVTIAGNLIALFANLTPASDLEFRQGIDAPSVRVEGLTVAGR